MDNNLIDHDSYPIGHEKNGNPILIKLLSVSQIKKLPEGTKIWDVTGREIEIGKSNLDLETQVFNYSKYGKLIKNVEEVLKRKLKEYNELYSKQRRKFGWRPGR
jgi:hypothetical protein